MEIKKDFASFQAWVNILRTISEEQIIVADEQGLHVVGMDPSHVAMINTDFNKELFESYEAEEDDKIAINVNEFYRFLDRAKKEERVLIEKDEKNARLLLTVKKGTRVREFRIPTLADTDSEVPDPKIFFKAKSRITWEGFNLGLNDANLVSEHIVLDYKGSLMKLEGYGDMGDAFAQWDEDSDDILKLVIDEDSKATYTLSYIMDIVKAVKPLAEVLTIELATDMPIKIEAECIPGIKAEFYLAPCIGV
jgi:proliferating cell nuclear antigen